MTSEKYTQIGTKGKQFGGIILYGISAIISICYTILFFIDQAGNSAWYVVLLSIMLGLTIELFKAQTFSWTVTTYLTRHIGTFSLSLFSSIILVVVSLAATYGFFERNIGFNNQESRKSLIEYKTTENQLENLNQRIAQITNQTKKDGTSKYIKVREKAKSAQITLDRLKIEQDKLVSKLKSTNVNTVSGINSIAEKISNITGLSIKSSQVILVLFWAVILEMAQFCGILFYQLAKRYNGKSSGNLSQNTRETFPNTFPGNLKKEKNKAVGKVVGNVACDIKSKLNKLVRYDRETLRKPFPKSFGNLSQLKKTSPKLETVCNVRERSNASDGKPFPEKSGKVGQKKSTTKRRKKTQFSLAQFKLLDDGDQYKEVVKVVKSKTIRITNEALREFFHVRHSKAASWIKKLKGDSVIVKVKNVWKLKPSNQAE